MLCCTILYSVDTFVAVTIIMCKYTYNYIIDNVQYSRAVRVLTCC